MKNNNVIHRNSQTLIFLALLDSNVWKKGDIIKVEKKDGYYRGFNNRTLQYFQMCRSHFYITELLQLVMQY